MAQIPMTYRTRVLGESTPENISVTTDPHCLALMKHFRSLIPMAMEAHKPMFQLKPSDGALGAHGAAVQDAYHSFNLLAKRLLAPKSAIHDMKPFTPRAFITPSQCRRAALAHLQRGNIACVNLALGAIVVEGCAGCVTL